jgi:hypothetical protein
VTAEAKYRLAARDKYLSKLKTAESDLALPGYILLAWARTKYGPRSNIRAWYVPCDGKRWVYEWAYDDKTMRRFNNPYRSSCSATYYWLTGDSEKKDLFGEFHICAPPYILLDSAELRQEYLKGKLSAMLA